MADNPYNSIYQDPYSNPYQSPYHSPYQSPYQNPYQTPYQNPYQAAPKDDDEDSGAFGNINIMEWLIRIVHYWYLFIIGLIIALGFAYLKNRKWIPQRMSSCTLIIKESSPYGNQQGLLMQGFGVGQGYSNINNQMIMLGSYDLIGRVVDSLPILNVDYITQGRFKTRNLYRETPIVVEYEEIANNAYSLLFKCIFEEDGSLTIRFADEDNPFQLKAHYGEPVSCEYFTATFWPTERMVKSGHIYFCFRSRGSLIDEFLSRLTLNFVTEGSTVLRLSLVGEVPQRDCEFLDKLQDIYLLQNLERKNQVAENSIRFIESQLEELQGNLSVSEGAMTEFRQENKFSDVSSYAGQLIGQMTAYDQEHMQLRLKETYLDYLDNYLHQQIEEGAVVAPASLGISDPMLMQFVGQLNDLMIQRSELSEKNVYYAKYTSDIERVKDGLKEVIKTMRASLNIEKKDLNNRYKKVEAEIKKLPEKELEMVAIERNYRIDDNYYTFFLQKRAEAEIQKASNTPDNEIMDRSRTSITTNANAKKKTTTTYCLVGLLIPLVLIILSELLNDKIRTPREANQVSDFRLIGSLRHAKKQNPVLVKANPRSRYAEMLRAIRTRIEFIVQRKTGISVCVTSTESGDGKTFLCTNLAALYGMTGKKCLLIDLDVRKPNIHEKLGLDAHKGITNYLIGECELEDVLIHDERFDFDLICAGTIPPNPGELIHSDKLSELLEKMRGIYDFIVIDTSPVGQVPDAYAIIEQTDTTLYVIRCLQTSKSMCRQTLEQLAIDHKEKIHLVLSDIPIEGFHRGYNYGYAYGYGSRTGYGYGKGYGYGYGYGYGSDYYGEGEAREKKKHRLHKKD